MEKDIEQKIQEVLDTVRPDLQMDGGDVEYKFFNPETGCVDVALQGMCKGCPMAEVTLKMYIEQELKNAIPEIKEVRGV